ncbi:hypothetical protein D9756_002346 [Leucocoprinus leucothites]|uniref:F-box domain-containing protein n=1 Tax=Leucocoprinus leucothites TaxID=201217 RepID=A0A8H5GC27_9AGAR|nr:hypothetical protein D9756_002346 [Leucoagaricus leucothites]
MSSSNQLGAETRDPTALGLLDIDAKFEARQNIDSRLQMLNTGILGLSTERNELASIPIPPSEVFAAIVMLLRDACHAPNSQNRNHWLRVTHVCRHWREIALACLTLWSRLSFATEELADMMLQRSRMAPLTVKASIKRFRWDLNEQIERTMGHRRHIRHLQVGCDSRKEELSLYQRVVLDPLTSAFPLLETAMLRLLRLPDVSRTLPPVTLADNAFAESPRLHTLELHGVNVNWESTFPIGPI